MHQPDTTPGARLASRLCTCGHEASKHSYLSGACVLGRTGEGRSVRPCKCKRFAIAQNPISNNSNHPK